MRERPRTTPRAPMPTHSISSVDTPDNSLQTFVSSFHHLPSSHYAPDPRLPRSPPATTRVTPAHTADIATTGVAWPLPHHCDSSPRADLHSDAAPVSPPAPPSSRHPRA